MEEEAFISLEKFNPVRKYSSLTGFTLLEMLIVIIIIGILATLAVIQYQPYKESTLDREAQANLKLIYAAERIYKFENDNNIYYSDPTSNNNAGINTGLKLQLPTSTSNWNYTLNTCMSGFNSKFTAQATRTLDGRNWCLTSNDPGNTNDPVPGQPSPVTNTCSSISGACP